MKKVLSFRFQQRFSPITMLLVEGSCETGLFRVLSNHGFRGLQVQKYISYEGYFFWKCSKWNLNFENAKKKKNLPKSFFFWDSCSSICCYKLRLLRRKYLSSAVNGLTKSTKVLDITHRDSFKVNWLHGDQ